MDFSLQKTHIRLSDSVYISVPQFVSPLSLLVINFLNVKVVPFKLFSYLIIF